VYEKYLLFPLLFLNSNLLQHAYESTMWFDIV